MDYIAGFGTDDSGDTVSARPPGVAKALGGGHCVSENISRNGRPIARWHPIFGEEARERISRVRRRLVQKYGEERTYRMADTSRNLLIYPNLLIMDFVAISIRYIEPVAPDSMEVTAWHLVPREETGPALATRLDSYLTFLGPGGFATPDDVEVLESCQAGFRATEAEWSDISRGMLNPCPGTSDELQMRGFWRQWHAHMQGPGPDQCPGPVACGMQVEAFLFREAALLDEWRLEEWLDLFYGRRPVRGALPRTCRKAIPNATSSSSMTTSSACAPGWHG